MAWYYILAICAGGALALLLLLFTILSAFAYKIAFGSRCDKNPLLKYFTAEDFGLTYEKVAVKSGKIDLNGCIYEPKSGKNSKILVIFCHGLGAGHAAYTTEINHFCESGFTVLALDNAGCNLSGGKSIKGMYSGVKTAKAAYEFARSQARFAGYKICLVGHSWGGYSALCASAETGVDGVVALSAPLTPSLTVCTAAAQVLPKFLAACMRPFLAVRSFFAFGTKGNLNAAKCVKKSGVPALVIHGDFDNVVPIKASAFAADCGEKAEKLLAEGKSHNPYNTPAAQKLMVELSAALSKPRLAPQDIEYIKAFDFVAGTEEDVEIMSKIDKFLFAL